MAHQCLYRSAALSHVTGGQKPNAVKYSTLRSKSAHWQSEISEHGENTKSPSRSTTLVHSGLPHRLAVNSGTLSVCSGGGGGSGVSGLSAGVRWVEYLIKTSFRACLELWKRDLSLNASTKTLTRIIYRHVSTYMCFEGTCYTLGQALSWETHRSELGRKTGQLSVKVEAVWIWEVSHPRYRQAACRISVWREQLIWKIQNASIVLGLERGCG